MTDLAPSRNIAGNGLVKVAKPGRKVRYGSTVPESVLQDPALNAAISLLPENYNFEIHKCVWKVRSESIKTVALQFPEGLLMYACVITDIIARFGGAKVIVLGDVTYGACCVDDYTAQKLGAELLIHYGHSCLVPISTTRIKVLYVFVEIQFDTSHLVSVLTKHFESGCRIALMGTIQFTNALHRACQELSSNFPNMRIPQGKPLSPGETLGCTAPILLERDAIVFVADGRFHLEAAMIQNPTLPAYRYDPYSKILSSEGYDTVRLKADRWKHILKARDASTFGIILGTLGRQGSPAMFQHARRLLTKHGKRTVQFLMAEIVPQKLQLIKHVDAWVQIACPRLSMDWGSELPKPLLTAYELQVALGEVPWSEVYPMDYYSSSGGQWSNNVLAHEKDSSRL